MPTDDLPALLPVKAITQRFGISRSQIYRWLDEKRLTGKKMGRSTYVETDSVKAAIEALPAYRT